MNHDPSIDRRAALAATLLLPWTVRAQGTPALDVHYVPTPMPVVDKMLELARIQRGDTVFDLGCGDGRIVIAAVKRFGARGVGIDLDPVRLLLITQAQGSIFGRGAGRPAGPRPADRRHFGAG
jgi:predicted RNA methylase